MADPHPADAPAQPVRTARRFRLVLNYLFIDAGHLTGPGVYAVELLENIVAGENAAVGEFDILCLCDARAMHHFSAAAHAHLRPVRIGGGRFARVLYEQLVLPFLLIGRGTDLLFSPAFVSPLWGGRRRVVAICDMYFRVIPDLLAPFQRNYWRLMVPLSVARCARVITISDNSRRDIERYIPAARGKTVSIPLASRLAPSPENPADAGEVDDFVLIVANLTANKNCDVVVAALAALRDAGRPLRLVHVGKDHLGLLAASTAAHAMEGMATSLGKVSDEVLAALYRSSLCTVVASLYEGFGLPAVEAQQVGTVLVCSNTSSLPEAAGDGALFFDPRDPAALAAAIARVHAMTGDERRRWIARGRAAAARFSWARTARETLAVFREVLRGQ